MFAKLDREEGTTRYSDDTEPVRNAKLVMTAIAPVSLVESLMKQLDASVLEVAEFHHRAALSAGKKKNEIS
jgi:hypothetical protein